MKQYKDIILHGASLFRQLEAGHPNGSLATVSIAAAVSGARRALKQRTALGAGGGGDEPADDDISSMLGGGDGGSDLISSLVALGIVDEPAGDDLFSSMLGEVDEYLEQCGISVNDMWNKAFGAYFLYGPGLNLDNLVNGNFDDLYSIPSIEDVAPMLLALKDADEGDCTAEDITKLVSASKNYLQCSGVAGEVFDLEASNLELEMQRTLEDVADACEPAFDSLLSLGGDFSDDFFDEDSDIGKLTKPCLQSVLGDNLIGNLIRYEYKNLDKVLGCTKSYSEELPRCIMSASIEGGMTFSIPLSLSKKLYCLIGVTSDDVIEGICTGLYEMLEGTPAEEYFSVEEYFYEPVLGIDVSVIDGDELPSYCPKIYEDQGMDGAGLQSRFDYYNVHRKHGWTVEPGSTSPQVNAKFPAVSLSTSARNGEDGEATGETATDKTKTTFFTAGGGFAVLAIAAVAIYLKPKKTGGAGYSYVSKAFGNTLV